MVTLQALAGRGVGFGLSGPLCQQSQRLFGRRRDGFFDVTQILFRVLLDGLQARLVIGAPSLEFGVAQTAFGNGGGGRSRLSLGGAFGDNLLGQALSLYGLALASQSSANLA